MRPEGTGSSKGDRPPSSTGPTSNRRRAAGRPPLQPRQPILSNLRPLRSRSDSILPVALILSVLAHFIAFALVLTQVPSSHKPLFNGPVVVRLIELPKGVGGETEGTPGKTAVRPPPKVTEPPVRQEKPKTTLPGKAPPPPKEGASVVQSEKPGKALGLGHGGQTGLGGKAEGLILDEPTFQYAWYKARLEDTLKANWRKPVLNNTKTISASVHFMILANGTVQGVQLVSPSGIAQFDQSVLRAVYSSVPFPHFPPQYTDPQLGVLYTFELLPEGQNP